MLYTSIVNISGTDQANQQAENSVINYDFFPCSVKTI